MAAQRRYLPSVVVEGVAGEASTCREVAAIFRSRISHLHKIRSRCGVSRSPRSDCQIGGRPRSCGRRRRHSATVARGVEDGSSASADSPCGSATEIVRIFLNLSYFLTFFSKKKVFSNVFPVIFLTFLLSFFLPFLLFYLLTFSPSSTFSPFEFSPFLLFASYHGIFLFFTFYINKFFETCDF